MLFEHISPMSALFLFLALTTPVFMAGYFLGSIPFGVIFTRLAGLGDIRKIGSGNTGATNVLRTGNKKLAAATLLCDMLKGTAAIAAAPWFIPFGFHSDKLMIPAIAGFGALLGHIFPVWLKFRGGKGVATYLGVLFGLVWPCALVFAIIWLATAFLTRYSSLSALVAVIAVPFSAWFFIPPEAERNFAIAGIALMSLIVILKHQSNIRRLLNGTESRIGSKAE